jgi:crossover junction endodeoxyribonuclease RuvC
MRVLGIDCGSERTGYGVIESDGRLHSLIAAGTIRTSPKQSLGIRLAAIARELREVIARDHPAEAAVEEVFHAVNAKSALKLAHVRGAALLVLSEHAVPYAEYSPLTVKQSVVGHGRAEKEQVQFMVRMMLGDEVPAGQPDACDALAVAICHAARRVWTARVAAS